MRKRRQRLTWFPTLGTNWLAGASELAGNYFEITVNPAGQQLGVFPVTFDSPQSEATGTKDTPLNSIVGSEYILKRIVGKVHLGIKTISAQDQFDSMLIAAGFFVARAADDVGGSESDYPLGYAGSTGLERNDNFSPLSKRTIREPWIWRRTWILGLNGTTQTPAGTGTAAWPLSNAFYGGLGDGPHIDAKSARRVGNDDRLFFAVSAMPFPPVTDYAGDMILQGYLDIRLLGSLVKAHNKSTF